MAVGREDELHIVLFAGRQQCVQRLQVVTHMAVRRVDHRGAAVQDVVAREQQPVFHQQQADMVGGMAGGVDGLQRMSICQTGL